MAVTDHPRIAVVGPGAVGAYVAAHLVRSGRAVLSCARRPFVRYLVESNDHPADEPAEVVVTPDAITGAPFDLVLVCVKVTATPSIGPWLQALCGPATLVVSVQNGIDAAELLAPYVPAGRVLPSAVYCGVQLLEPGHVRHTTGSRLVVPAGADGDVLAGVFAGSAVELEQTADFRTAVWRKLGVNVAVNGVTALTNQTTNVFSERPDAARLASDLLRECWAIARLDGADLTDELAAQTAAGLAARPIGVGTSMLYDRRAGVPTEHDAIYGAVVRAAERLGTDAPLARAIDTLLAASDPTG